MDWAALKTGFRDELAKIGEVNLSGLSAETLMNYPQREPMPSAAYEKAQAILAKMQPGGAEKTADLARTCCRSFGASGARRATHLPRSSTRRSATAATSSAAQVPPSSSAMPPRLACRLSTPIPGQGRHRLQGHEREVHRGQGVHSRRWSALGLGTSYARSIGASSGSRRKPHMKKRAGVANLGAEELAQTDLKVLTRARTRAAAELLFSQANVAKAKEQRLLGTSSTRPRAPRRSLRCSPRRRASTSSSRRSQRRPERCPASLSGAAEGQRGPGRRHSPVSQPPQEEDDRHDGPFPDPVLPLRRRSLTRWSTERQGRGP